MSRRCKAAFGHFAAWAESARAKDLQVQAPLLLWQLSSTRVAGPLHPEGAGDPFRLNDSAKIRIRSRSAKSDDFRRIEVLSTGLAPKRT